MERVVAESRGFIQSRKNVCFEHVVVGFNEMREVIVRVHVHGVRHADERAEL